MLKTIGLSAIGLTLFGLWYCCPAFKPFPKPTGNYEVGTTSLELTDQSRKEIYSENSDDNRKLSVRFYYPTQITSESTKYPYLGKKMPYFQQYIANQYHLTNATTKLLFGNITTHAYENVPLAEANKKYPVILFSHGLLGFPSDTSAVILENLASHGYIVAAIDHPYFNGLTLYQDGKVVTSQKLSEQFNKMRWPQQKEFQTQAIEIYKADFKFFIDELAKLNIDPNSIFYNRLDLNRIAVMGHSAGGTASIEFCRADTRCKAAINLDGWYDQVIGHEPIKQPLLLIFAEKSLEVIEPTPEYLKRKELTRDQYFEREKNIAEHRKALCNTPNCKTVIIPGTTHSDFDDMMLLKWPFRSWNAIDPYKTLELVNSSIVQFLNIHL
ncbi:MAG: esterase [Candidatus Babeliales bacterium]